MLEGKQDIIIAIEKPSVATKYQLGANPSLSATVQSFFKAELRAIKEKQVQQNEKLNKASAQL